MLRLKMKNGHDSYPDFRMQQDSTSNSSDEYDASIEDRRDVRDQISSRTFQQKLQALTALVTVVVLLIWAEVQSSVQFCRLIFLN